jgi:hypothetical protein
VQSLKTLISGNNNTLSTPFSSQKVVSYFLSKDYATCGGAKKLLFNQEFAEEIKNLPFKINRKAQQIESGIRDMRKVVA